MANASARRLILIVGFSAILAIVFVTSFRNQPFRDTTKAPPIARPVPVTQDKSVSQADLSGHVIAPKLGNETIKAELGRASWKLLHTIIARFPDAPTPDEREALRSYIHLFQRLYPCGECAEHFKQILDKYPPQVSSRSTAAGWACHVHNEVNKSLDKELFDCAKIGDFYDCGCADDEKDSMNIVGAGGRPSMGRSEKEMLTGANGRAPKEGKNFMDAYQEFYSDR